MSLKYIDGFDQYASGALGPHIVGSSSSISHYAWTSYKLYGANDIWIDKTLYRTEQPNAGALRIYDYNSLYMSIPENETIILGFAMMPALALPSYTNILIFSNNAEYTNGNGGLHLQIMGDGSLRLLNEATNQVVERSTGGVVGSLIWQYIEMKISFGASASYEVRVNGDTVLSGTGVDTFCGQSYVRGFNLCVSASQRIYFDDFYICDTAGTKNNDFLGPIGVYTLLPSANGSVNDFSIQGAASNYESVNTVQPGTTTYVYSGTTGHKDLYQVADLPISAGTVHGVQLRSYIQKMDNGTRSTQLVLKTGANEASTANFTATLGSWLNAFAVFENQADGTSAWDIAAVNSMEIGHKNT